VGVGAPLVVGGILNEWLVVGGIACAAASGVPGLLLDRRSAAGERLALAVLATGAVLGAAGAARALLRPTAGPGLELAWSVPGGALRVQVDALSAMFLLQVFVLSLLGAVYGLGYWKQTEHAGSGRKVRLFYGLVTAGMATLVAARNAVLFLAGWEIMAIAAFALVSTEDQDHEVREVGYVYLVATRVGTLCLFAMFAMLFVARGSFELSGPIAPPRSLANAIFVLGFVGFGLKAGAMPFHIWLPGAHASAPSHVSALMSGVLIKMGIYGLIRMTSLFSAPPVWWGGLVLGSGIVSGVLGVAFAIGQHDLKRLLAYHSVENIGIIYIGLGLALVGRSIGRPELIVLGLGGALLHVWNHGLFKGLLFLAAGSVVHATGTRQIDQLGGLLKRMPRTGLAFLIGAAAICGLPPLNGFISELLIYVGLLRGSNAATGALALGFAFSTVGLALIGALALACFVKVSGAVFLGEPRSLLTARAHEAGTSMTFPMGVLAVLCAFIGTGSLLVTSILDRASGAAAPGLALPSTATLAPLLAVTVMGGALVVLVAGLGGWLAARTRHAPSSVGTWDCGYALPTARMQYTSSSFAETLVGMFSWALRPRLHQTAPHGPFPHAASFHSHVPEVVLDELLVPAGRAVGHGLRWFRWVQRGSVHAYLVYILATLVLLLIRQGGR
jgi:hydrogenase-4 component B